MLETLTTETRRQRAIEITGINPQAAVNMQLDKLRQEGILVDLNISGTNMFQRTPNWLELGIAEFAGDKRAEQFSKGQKFVFPEDRIKALKSIESRLRQNLINYSYDVTGIRPYRWLPYTAYAAWREKHDKIVADGELLKHDLIDHRDRYVDEIALVYTTIAEEAWAGVTGGIDQGGNRVQLYDYVRLTDKRGNILSLDHDAFIDYVVRSTVETIPTAADIEARLKFDYVTAMVYGDEDVAADQARAEAIRLQVSAEREQLDLAREYQRTENSMLQERARAEAWNIQTAQREREEKIAAMRQAEYDHHRQQLQETISPFAEVYRAAVAQFVDHAREILESVQKNGYVRGKVAERGRGLLDLYQLMVLPGMGDQKLETYLRELKALLPAASEGRSPEDIANKLRDIIALEAEAAENVQSVTGFSFIDLE
jgi:hypothetical protein